jgi:hypothetical protein
MKTALIVQHLAIETIGTFGPLLERLAISCSFVSRAATIFVRSTHLFPISPW